jgi:hypothetical protein
MGPCAALLAALLMSAAAAAQEADFTVDFGGPGKPVPTGIVTGLNDLANASPGVWKAYIESVQPRDSLVRIWLKYNFGELNDSHWRAAEEAKQAGMGVMITALGKPGSRVDTRKGEVQAAPEPVAWARKVATDVNALRAKGLPVTHVEIWNEPDMPEQWGGSSAEFARFFAAAGHALRPLLPNEVRIGGPGMAASYGGGVRQFAEIVEACKAVGWAPDFLSWHDYSGFPMDQAYYDTARRVTELSRRAGLQLPELILSEWNCGLPGRGSYPPLDDHRGAAAFVAMTCALSRTAVKHSLFFMLQDGSWDTDQDFAGESVGVFTLHGAPKSVLAGMRMMRTVCALPAVPAVARPKLPVNFALMATREGARGYLAAASSFGKDEQHGKKLIEMAGLDLGSIKGKPGAAEKYVRGQIRYEQTGLPAEQKPVWDDIAARIQALADERRAKERSLTVRLADAPARIEGVWVIDERHGNPIGDADFRAKFRPFEGGWYAAAAQLTMQKLRAEGVAEDELARIEESFRKRQEHVPGLATATAQRLREVYADMSHRAQFEVPRELARHPAAAPARVEIGDWVRLEGDLLRLRLPPHTSVMIEFAW